MPFDLQRDLPHILGSLGGLSGGSSAFADRWHQLEEQDRQRKLQAQQQQMQQGQYGLQQQANTRANQDQLLQTVGSVNTFLGDASIDNPDVYAQREQLLMGLAPKLGVDPGFIQSLRPAPTVFQQRAAKKKLDEIAKTYSPAQMQMLENDDASGSAPVFQVNGETLTIGQLRQRVGAQPMTAQGQPMSMRVPVKPDVPNTPEEQFYQRFATEHGAKTFGELPTTLQGAARKQWMQSDDRAPNPVLDELQRLRLEQAQNAARQMPSLPPQVQRRVDNKARGFDQQPVVRTIQKQAEAVTFANSLDPNTKNSADDQALIYAFAKAMDPDSVVREGEYATVQKYAQSWAQTYGFNVARIFSNTAFLTPEARANMKVTIQKKFAAGKQQYDNLRRSYGHQIDVITGGTDGEDHLVDYGGGFPEAPDVRGRAPASTGPVVRPPSATAPTAAPLVNPFRR